MGTFAQRRGSKVPWPLLYPNPGQPGKTPFSDMRKKMLARFDKDGDGFLSKTERETMRLATKVEAQERSRRVAELRESVVLQTGQPLATRTTGSTGTSGKPHAARKSSG